MNIKERIQKYLDSKSIKTATFEREVGLSNGYWRKTKSISADMLATILRRYSDLSVDYVMKGVEPMLCCYQNSAPPEAPFMVGEPEPGTSRTDQEKDDRIRFLEQQLKLEKDKNDLLQQQLNLYEGRV
jgi:hypothetical protein